MYTTEFIGSIADSEPQSCKFWGWKISQVKAGIVNFYNDLHKLGVGQETGSKGNPPKFTENTGKNGGPTPQLHVIVGLINTLKFIFEVKLFEL